MKIEKKCLYLPYIHSYTDMTYHVVTWQEIKQALLSFKTISALFYIDVKIIRRRTSCLTNWNELNYYIELFISHILFDVVLKHILRTYVS